MYSTQLESGDKFPGLRPSRSIFLLKHPLYSRHREIAHHTLRVYHEPLMVAALDHFRLDFVELSKLVSGRGRAGSGTNVASAVSVRLKMWAHFFMNAKNPKMIESIMTDPLIKKTFDKLKQLSADEEAKQLARARELGLLRVSLELRQAREEGQKQGQEEGRKQGQEEGREEAQSEMIRQLLSSGMSEKDIAKALNISLEEIERLLTIGR